MCVTRYYPHCVHEAIGCKVNTIKLSDVEGSVWKRSYFSKYFIC